MGNMSLIAIIPTSDMLFKSSMLSHCGIGGEEVDNEVRAADGADVEGSAAEALEGELALADEGVDIMAGLGVKLPEDLDDQLVMRHVLI
ncbi:hypothetical protein ACFX11_042477 [Malus domestica]